MRLVSCVCLLLAGCGFEHGIAGDDQPPQDGSIDSPDGMGSDGPCTSYSTLFDSCAAMMGMSGVTLTPGMWDYNTDSHRLSMGASTSGTILPSMVINASAGPIDVIFVSSFTVQEGATLRVTGPMMHRAFGIASSGPVQIDGIVDLSNDGAGARTDVACGGLLGKPGENNNGGGSGGGGAGFAAKGGDGSDGNADGGTGQQTTGAAGGAAIPARPTSPIGGCDGGRGGGTNGSLGGDGGNGGGAIYVASGTSISVGSNGVIDVGGQGGYEGGNNGDAGGGAGAGGMIVIESKSVTIAGTLVANGGGGGEGNTNGVRGENGTRTTTRAKGGQDGDANGGDGGDGGAGSNLAGQTTTDVQNGGGGGGGGSVGFIAIGGSTPTTSGATISPAFAAWP